MPLRSTSSISESSRDAARRRRASRRRSRIAVALTAFAVAALAVAALSNAGSQSSPRTAGAPVKATDTSGTLGTAVEPSAPATRPASVKPAPALPATLTVAAVGDMHFDRQVKQLIEREGGLAPLVHVAAHLSAADVTVGNLESPLSNGGTPWPDKDVRFRGDPRAIEGIKASGFTFLSLANNHILDYGAEALRDTVLALDTAGVRYAGAGANRSAAWKPAVAAYGETTVAFLSFSHILPAGFIATDSRAGLAPGRTDMEAVARAISAAKEEHDYVIVSFHWGVEYKDNANAGQIRDGRVAIDAGANMVLSHHPHVIQGVEFYNGGLIAYSLGDFVFDHYSRRTGEAFILDAELGPHGVANVRATPVYLQGFGQPKFVHGTEATSILERLKAISGPHGTSVIIEGDTARLVP
ncbi:MAG: CapA family protein [Clostridiales bacterium]|nr:CapA family protein [Clostridiales bacterium]